jgi:hypothetical protein
MPLRKAPRFALGAEDPSGWKFFALKDVLPQEAIELIIPILSDLEANRISSSAAETALLWILKRYEEDIRASGRDIEPAYLAKVLTMIGTVGGSPIIYKRIMEDVAREAGIGPPPPRTEEEAIQEERLRQSAVLAIRRALPVILQRMRYIPPALLKKMEQEIEPEMIPHAEATALDAVWRGGRAAMEILGEVASLVALLARRPGGVDFLGEHFEVGK